MFIAWEESLILKIYLFKALVQIRNIAWCIMIIALSGLVGCLIGMVFVQPASRIRR